MMKKFLITCILITVSTVLPTSAYALAVAEIKLNSSLNQELDATIDIISASPEELDSLITKVSRLSQQSGSLAAWPNIRVNLVRVEKGRSYLKITSDKVVREPILEFLLDLEWSKGQLKREYSLMVNPQ